MLSTRTGTTNVGTITMGIGIEPGRHNRAESSLGTTSTCSVDLWLYHYHRAGIASVRCNRVGSPPDTTLTHTVMTNGGTVTTGAGVELGRCNRVGSLPGTNWHAQCQPLPHEQGFC